MSRWTYVNGIIKVDTMSRSSAESMYKAQTVVNHLPRITGSERCVQYYLNLVNGHNFSSNTDEFDNFSNLYNSDYFNSFETQTYVLIAMDGSLRDREFKQTLFETTRALSRLASRLWIDICLVSVRGDAWSGKEYVFNNPKWLRDMEHNHWAEDLLWKFAEEEGGDEE